MNVLLGIGGTDDSLLALDDAVARAADTGDDLTVAVLENPRSERSPDTVEARVREALDGVDLTVVDAIEDPGRGGRATVVRVPGDPGPELVDFAEREGFDEIVLSGGERSPMGKIQIGPIAEFVLLNTQTTVTLVR